MKKSICTFVLGLTASVFAFAQETTPEPKKEEGKFTVSGYIDSYYMHNLNSPASGNSMGYYPNYGATNYMRAFDRLNNQFSLGLVQTKFAYTNSKSELMIDLTFGPNAELGNFGNQRLMVPGGYTTGYYPGNANQSALYGTSAAIKQAYFKYNVTDKLSFTVGQFGTHIGYEVIDAPVNFHYSLSNLFNNGPFYHVGAKVNYAFSDKLGVMVGLVNNWDALTDWKTQKSVIAQVFVSPVDGFNIYLNYIGGHNDDGFKVQPSAGIWPGATNTAYSPVFLGNASYNRQLFDITTGYQINEKLYVGLNAAYGWYDFKAIDGALPTLQTGGADTDSTTADDTFLNGEEGIKAAFRGATASPSWYGLALYTTYTITDFLAAGIRLEHFSDKYAVRYANTINNSLTLTVPITLADGHLIIKPEARFDVSPDEVYENHDGSPRKSQNTLGMAFIYKY